MLGIDTSEALAVAIDASNAAAEIIMARAGNPDNIRTKGVHDLVTETDEECERLVAEAIRDTYPDHEIVAEEGVADRGESRFRWIVDPIDGTTNFSHGIPPYAVSIALEVDGDLVLGVVNEVGRQELFTAVRGRGAFLNGQRLQVSTRNRLDDALLATGFPYRAFEHRHIYLEVLGNLMISTRGVRRMGSAATDLCYVAAGRFDGFFETGLREWDVAAGVLIVEESGGVSTDYRGQPRGVYGRQILATNGLLHDELMKSLESMRDIRL